MPSIRSAWIMAWMDGAGSSARFCVGRRHELIARPFASIAVELNCSERNRYTDKGAQVRRLAARQVDQELSDLMNCQL